MRKGVSKAWVLRPKSLLLNVLLLLAIQLIPSYIHALELKSFNCEAPLSTEQPVVLESSQSRSIQSLGEAYERVYQSGRRLDGRIYFDSASGEYRAPWGNSKIKVAPEFIRNIINHIELALERGYADFAFYPDMGHAHVLTKLDSNNGTRLTLEQALASEVTKVLYHTAELLRLRPGTVHNGPLPEDPWLSWRYHSRNFVGDNKLNESLSVLFGGKDGGYNTVRNIPTYGEVGRIYLSSSKDGCFAFKTKGKLQYIDFSFRPLPGSGY